MCQEYWNQIISFELKHFLKKKISKEFWQRQNTRTPDTNHTEIVTDFRRKSLEILINYRKRGIKIEVTFNRRKVKKYRKKKQLTKCIRN